MTADLRISEPIYYAQNGASQCWTCKHCVGQKEFIAEILDPLEKRYVKVLLPECKLVECYMTYTTAIPCKKFEVIKTEEDK